MKELVIESGLSKCQLFSFFFVSLGQKHLLTVVLTRMLVAGYAVFAVCTIISSTNSFMDKMCDSCAWTSWLLGQILYICKCIQPQAF